MTEGEAAIHVLSRHHRYNWTEMTPQAIGQDTGLSLWTKLRLHRVMNQAEGRPVVRFPEQLRLHRALEELGWIGVIDELNDAARLTNPSVTESILITTNGTILAGFGRWRLAVFGDRHEIHCIEYALSDDESLQFILTHHQTRCGWNAFVRIRLALTLEPYFQKRALDNMRAGASTRVGQICRKLSILMCAERLPAPRGSAPATSAT